MRTNTALISVKTEGTESPKINFLSETSSFIKQQISQIISQQLKAHNLRTKLQKDLQIHNKKQQQNKIKKSYYEQKVKSIPIKQKTLWKKKYEDFIKIQKERSLKFKYFIIQKKGNHQNKFDCINRSIQTVKNKADNIMSEDIKHRLAKISPSTSHGFRKSLNKSLDYSRTLSTSHNNSRCHIVKSFQEDRQTQLVSNYLKKIMKSQAILLQKDLTEYGQKKNNPHENKVICFVDMRKKKEEELMNRVEKQYNERMQAFNINKSHLQEYKEEVLMNKIASEKQLQRSALIRKQQYQTNTINNFMKNFRIKQQKQNQIIQKKRQLQAQNSKKLYNRKIEFLKQQRNKAQLNNKLKYLSIQFQKIKNANTNEKLDEKALRTIIEMMDKNDPQYHNFVQFLKTEKKIYMQNIIKKEQERGKMDKNKKVNKINNN